VNLTQWARLRGVHPQTAYRWFREGTLPVPAVRVNSRSVLVSPEAALAPPSTAFGLYARVCSHDQKSDLDRQVTRLSTWAAQAGGQVVRVEAEIGSGMNGSRSKVRRLLADPNVTAVVVEHRDRLGRMNTELVEAALSAHGRRLVVLEEGYGYKTAQNAHRAHAYKSVSPAKKRQREAIKKSVRRWCVKNSDFMGDIEQAMFYAMNDGDTFTEADVSALLKERTLELPFTVKELMRHW